jgi:multidrug resistance efflux pump
LLTIGSLVWYLVTVRPSSDLQIIGTVDANEVQVSSRIAGRLATLTVTEGQQVKAGELIATIESDDLAAALRAAEAAAGSQTGKLGEAVETVQQTRGETSSATVSTEAQVRVAEAALAQANANLEHQKADTSRTVVLADQGIMSAQSRDEAVTSLHASEAAVTHELLTTVSERTVAATRNDVANARALADQARVTQSYAQVFAPVSGRVNVWATRQGEVVSAGTPIVTIQDLTQTWVYAPLPETQSDAVQLGDSLRIVMPSGGTVWGKVINKAAEADFATQRDVSDRKRDIKTIQLKLLIDNPGEKYVPGMTAEIYIPKAKLVKK